MVAQRNVLILFMELKDLSTLGVVTAIVKKKPKKTVRMKEMFEFNSASKESSVLGRQCAWEVLLPRPTGFQTPACSMIK